MSFPLKVGDLVTWKGQLSPCNRNVTVKDPFATVVGISSGNAAGQSIFLDIHYCMCKKYTGLGGIRCCDGWWVNKDLVFAANFNNQVQFIKVDSATRVVKKQEYTNRFQAIGEEL